MRGTKRYRSGGWNLEVWDATSGTRRYRTVRAPDTRDGAKKADAALRALIDEIEAGRPHVDMTVAELFGSWQTARAAGWSPRTRDTHRYCADLICSQVGTMPLSRLRPLQIQQAYGVLGRTRSAGTVLRAHTALHSALSQAVRWDLIAYNPADRVSPPVVGERDDTTPTPDVLVSLLAAVEDRPDMAVYCRLASNAGPRRGSLAALRWTDLDLDAGLVEFARKLVLSSEGVADLPGSKTGKPYQVAIRPVVIAALRRWKVVQAEQALALGVRLPADGWVFSQARDPLKPRRPDYWTREWRRLTRQFEKDSGLAEGTLERIRLQDLRHYVATQLLAAGASVRTVADRLNHSNPSMTLAVYGHKVPATDHVAAGLLEEIEAAAIEAQRRKAQEG